jgi:hypothetical protein
LIELSGLFLRRSVRRARFTVGALGLEHWREREKKASAGKSQRERTVIAGTAEAQTSWPVALVGM